jgi:pyruvyltransferase
MLVKKITSTRTKTTILILILSSHLTNGASLPLFYWHEKFLNFGDYLALILVERIVGQPIREYQKSMGNERKFLSIGSILTFANDNDIVWGSGVNGKWLDPKHYKFKKLDVRAVRGPLTRDFLIKNFNIKCPEIYGDPALLIPHLFPEFKRKKNPSYTYLIIPHYSEQTLFPKSMHANVVYPTDPWQQVLEKILDSKLVISSSLHGIIVAEAFGIPARLLRPKREPLFKYHDYYLGTKRSTFTVAETVEEALVLGGEPPAQCDIQKLYETFPFEFWPDALFKSIEEV